MTIFIRYNKERAAKLASLHDGYVKHLVKTWSDAKLKHCFDGRGKFQGALRRNRKVLQSRRKKFVIRKDYEDFFVPKNLRFSTKADCREETLYFKDAHRTGRLRQQHGEGPLATVDDHRRIRLFLSRDKLNALNKRHKKFSTFCRVELEPRDGTHLVEFEWDGASLKQCHVSEGIVSTVKEGEDVKHRINRIKQALDNILGISP
jgi:hypothetical protein